MNTMINDQKKLSVSIKHVVNQSFHEMFLSWAKKEQNSDLWGNLEI